MKELCFAIRQLLRNPGFTAVAVLTLALGIGANTAIFTLVDAVLLKSLPVRNPERLFFVTSGANPAMSYPLIAKFQQAGKDIGETLAYRASKVRMNTGAGNDVAVGQFVSGNYFVTLGVTPPLGRPILPGDDRTEAPPVTVISYDCWERRFGRDAAVVGRSLSLNGVVLTIIGVAPPGFHGLDAQAVPEAFVPVRQHALLTPTEPHLLAEYGSWVFSAVVRLNSGVNESDACSLLSALYEQVISENRGWIRAEDFQVVVSRGVALSPAGQGVAKLRDRFSRPLLVLMGASGLVFLVACANVGSLLLARGTMRRREIALRLAVGASRCQVARLLLAESLLLAGLGCLLGLALALWSSHGLGQFLPEEAVGITSNLGINARLLVFSVLAALTATVLVGIAPALRSSDVTLTAALCEGGRSSGSSGSISRLGKLLVISQVSLSLVLLVGASLFVRSLLGLVALDPGFQRDNVLLLTVQPDLTGYSEIELERLSAKLTASDLLQRLEVIPGVRSASLASAREFGDRPWWRMAITLVGTPDPIGGRAGTTMRWVTPKHFETLGIPVLRGRPINLGDSVSAPKVAVINEALARQYFGNTDPLGQRFKLASGLETLGEIEVVGIARDTRTTSLREVATPMFYLPFAQFPNTDNLVFALRCEGNPKSVASSARQVIESLDAKLAVTKVMTLSETVGASLVQERATATLSVAFGILALLLAAVGLYGVLAHAVSQRTREIGVRIALGAGRQQVLRLVIGQGMKLVVAGLVVGTASAAGLSRMLVSLLYGISPYDLVTFLMATLALSAVAVVACWLPARRAARVDPMVALRSE